MLLKHAGLPAYLERKVATAGEAKERARVAAYFLRSLVAHVLGVAAPDLHGAAAAKADDATTAAKKRQPWTLAQATAWLREHVFENRYRPLLAALQCGEPSTADGTAGGDGKWDVSRCPADGALTSPSTRTEVAAAVRVQILLCLDVCLFVACPCSCSCPA